MTSQLSIFVGGVRLRANSTIVEILIVNSKNNIVMIRTSYENNVRGKYHVCQASSFLAIYTYILPIHQIADSSSLSINLLPFTLFIFSYKHTMQCTIGFAKKLWKIKKSGWRSMKQVFSQYQEEGSDLLIDGWTDGQTMDGRITGFPLTTSLKLWFKATWLKSIAPHIIIYKRINYL